MIGNTLIYPMFAMVLLTFGVLVSLFRTRVRFVREGKVDPSYFKIYQDGTEPDASAKLARHFANLFESPVLFYAACISANFSSWAVLLAMWFCIAIGVATGSP